MFRQESIVAIAIGVSACMDAQSSLIESRGDHVVLATPEWVVPCNGTIHHYDDHVDFVREYLGMKGEDHSSFSLQYLPSDEAYETTPCDPTVSGCAIAGDRVAFVREARSAEHELAHLVITPEWGTAEPLLAEGLAEALGPSTDTLWSVRGESASPRGSLGNPDVDRRLAGRFITYLINRYGLERFELAYRASSAEDPLATKQVFEDVYGESFGELADEYLDELEYCFLEGPGCYEPPDYEIMDSLSLEISAGCEFDGYWGYTHAPRSDSQGPANWFSNRATIDIIDSGWYEVESEVSVVLAECAPCADRQVMVVDPVRSDAVSAKLDAGRYSLHIRPSSTGRPETGVFMVRRIPRRIGP